MVARNGSQPKLSCPAKAGHPVTEGVAVMACDHDVSDYWIIRFRG